MGDRSQLKGTPVSVLKNQEAEHRKLIGQNDRPGFLTMSHGRNKFRIFPKHPDTQSWIYPKAVHWVPAEIKDDNGKVIEIKNLPVFNSRVHGGTKNDIIEEYIEMVKKTLKDEAPDKVTERLAPILDWRKGMVINSNWVCYAKKLEADETGLIGRLELTSGTKEKLNALAAVESPNEPIVTDPFTDADDGVCILVDYDPEKKDAKGQKDMKNFYIVSLDRQKVDKFTTQLIPTPLTDQDVEEFFKLEPLEKLYKNVYTKKDFQRAVTGLQIVDEREKYGVFQSSEFLELVDAMCDLYPEGEGVEEGSGVEIPVGEKEVELPAKLAPKTPSKSNLKEVIAKPVVGDEFDKMDRTALKAYIKTELKGEITVMKSYLDPQIRDLIRDYIKTHSQAADEVESDEVESDEVDDSQASAEQVANLTNKTVAEVKEKTPVIVKEKGNTTPKTNDRLEALKKKHNLA